MPPRTGCSLSSASPDDSPELHAKDTYLGGDKKGDMKVINVMTHNALAGANGAATIWAFVLNRTISFSSAVTAASAP